MVEKNPITPEGAQKLRDELQHRKSTERSAITAMIAEARAHGDLSENAEYHAAKETEEEVTYRLLGADEADINNGSISITSPMARSLLGKEAGDEVKIRTPAGERLYEVLEVTFK